MAGQGSVSKQDTEDRMHVACLELCSIVDELNKLRLLSPIASVVNFKRGSALRHRDADSHIER